MPLIMGRDQLALKGIMGIETPAAAGDGDGDTVANTPKLVSVEPGLPEWSTEVPNSNAGGSVYFPMTIYEVSVVDDAAYGYLDVPYVENINEATQFTVQAWFKKSGGDSHNRAVWSIGAGGYQNGSSLYIWNNQTPYWNITDNGTGEYISPNNPTAFTTDTWYHVVCIKKADGSSMTETYINGNIQSSKHSIGTYVADTSGSFAIGIRDGAAGGYGDRGWVGYITEVCFWNTALDSNAVSLLYNSGDGKDASTISGSNVQGYWRMLEGSGVTVSGSAGGAPTATFRAKKLHQ